MKIFFISTIICITGVLPTSRIFGGQDATSGQFPFMVALNDEYNQYCNGVIVAPKWILTTASCLYYRSPDSEVYIGSHINQVNGTAYGLFERVTHPDYDDWTAQNDIALIRINTVLEYGDTIQQVELGEVPSVNSTCTVVGWGVTETEDYPPLQFADLTAIDLDLCQNMSAEYLEGYYLGPEQVCGLSPTGQGACYNDYGGALLCDGKLSGIFSYGVGFECGSSLPDVFTSIAAYSDWVHSYIGG